jgi:hypothetical protein
MDRTRVGSIYFLAGRQRLASQNGRSVLFPEVIFVTILPLCFRDNCSN